MNEEQYKSFVREVAAMRTAQNKYFQNRTKWDLNESKRLEKNVDAMLMNFSKSFPLEKSIQEQTKMF